MRRIMMRDAVKAYSDLNNQGMGYAPYTDVAVDDTVDNAIDAAVADGWELFANRMNSDEVAIMVNGDEDILAIGGDAHGRCAWAVDITQEL
jgi:hypothetical protein